MASKSYSNAEKLMAVVETWSRPLISQLPPPYNFLAPALTPVLSNFVNKVPDASIPSIVNDIIDNAVKQGSVKVFNVTLDTDDLVELQRLIRLNMPSEKVRKSTYEVITN